MRPEGFKRVVDSSGAEIYTAEIIYRRDREHLLLHCEVLQDNEGNFGFHYTPYNFDSNPGRSYMNCRYSSFCQMSWYWICSPSEYPSPSITALPEWPRNCTFRT